MIAKSGKHIPQGMEGRRTDYSLAHIQTPGEQNGPTWRLSVPLGIAQARQGFINHWLAGGVEPIMSAIRRILSMDPIYPQKCNNQHCREYRRNGAIFHDLRSDTDWQAGPIGLNTTEDTKGWNYPAPDLSYQMAGSLAVIVPAP